MALGRPVVCFIDRQWFPYRSDMPIQNAHPKQLTQTLENLVKNVALRQELGNQGLVYVHKYHDVRVIIDQCLEIYENC
jgi:hypothetical protein